MGLHVQLAERPVSVWVFVLVLLFAPDGEFGGPVELRVTATTQAGCEMVRSAAVKRLAENLVQHTISPRCERESRPTS